MLGNDFYLPPGICQSIFLFLQSSSFFFYFSFVFSTFLLLLLIMEFPYICDDLGDNFSDFDCVGTTSFSFEDFLFR